MEAAPHPWPAIGSLMLREGYVSKEQLEEVLRAQHDSPQQRISGWRLGELLVERGLMTQGQVAQLVAEQYELPFMDLDPARIDESVVHLLPADLVDRFSALPIETGSDGSLVLAVSDPATVLFSDELRRTLGRPLRFTVVAPDAMEAVVAWVRGGELPVRPQPVLAEWPSGAPAIAGVADEAPATGTIAHAPSYPPLGTLLVRDGLLTEDELESALAEQRLSDGKRLGEILVERGTVRPADVARRVAEQYELPFIDLTSFELDDRVCSLLPHDVAQRHSAVPLDFLSDGSLRVAIADPTKVLAPEDILAVLGARLSFAVADPDDVEAAIARLERPEDTTADAWAGFAPTASATYAAEDRSHADASDLIIVPAEELAHAAAETVERRGAQSDEREDALAHAPPEAAPVTEPDQHAPEPEDRASAEAAKRRRGWFRRRRGDGTAIPRVEASGETTPPDPIADLLRAGEAAVTGDATVDDPSSRSAEQAAVLRLWIGGDTAAPPASEVRDELGSATAATDLEPAENESESEVSFEERDSLPEALVDQHQADSSPPSESHDADLAGEPSGLSAVEPGTPAPAPKSWWTAAPEETRDVEPATAHVGLPEVAEIGSSEPETTAEVDSPEGASPDQANAEGWNVFAPWPVAEELEAPGEHDDAPPAELHDEAEHHHLAHEPAEMSQVVHEPEGAVEVEPYEATPDEALTETETAATHSSWLSWEPAEGAADPWHAAETAADETTEDSAEHPVEHAVEPAFEPWAPSHEDAEQDLEHVALADEHQTDEPAESWLAELEPDPPDADDAPLGLEDAPAAEVEQPPLERMEHPEHVEHSWNDEAFVPDVADDEPSALDLVVGRSAPEAAPHPFETPVLELVPVPEPEPYTEPVAVDPVTVELLVEDVDRGTLTPLVERATALGASTVHFSAQESGIVVRARVDGVLRKLDTVTGQARFELARELVLAAQSGTLAGGHVTSLPTPHGETVTIRFRPTGDAATLDALSLDPMDRGALERALRHSFGLVIVAGPAGSGQASTFSAALHELTSAERAVMTIEDPILHVIPGADQVAVDSSAGRGYTDGLRAILSADPDAIVVGELVDEETARLAVDAATGHLVVTSVLAQSAVGALDRLSLLGVDADLVASTLSLVVAQRLLRRLCDHCRVGHYASAADTAVLRRPDDEVGRRLLARGTGCAECGDTGFAGTIGVYEVLIPNDEVRALVASNAPASEVERAARLAGKRTLLDDAVRACLEGLTTVAEVQRVLGRALL